MNVLTLGMRHFDRIAILFSDNMSYNNLVTVEQLCVLRDKLQRLIFASVH